MALYFEIKKRINKNALVQTVISVEILTSWLYCWEVTKCQSFFFEISINIIENHTRDFTSSTKVKVSEDIFWCHCLLLNISFYIGNIY